MTNEDKDAVITKGYKCPFCGRISDFPPSVICPCEVRLKGTQDEEDWKNK